jgi:hypothetical protein
MECEVVLGTDTFAYFKTGHQRFCNEVRRKVVDTLQARFDPNQWSFQPKFFLRNIIDDSGGGGGAGGDIGFSCVIDMRLLQVPEGLNNHRAVRQRGYVPRGEIHAEVVQARWGGGGGGAGIPHRQRLIPRDDNDANRVIAAEFGARAYNNLYVNE